MTRDIRAATEVTRWVAAVICAAALVACGSTVPRVAPPAPSAGAPVGGTQGGLGIRTQVGTTYPATVEMGDAATPRPAAQLADGRAAATSSVLRPTAPLRIGVVFSDTTPAILKALGQQVDSGDPIRAVQVAADVLNARGGVAGRRLELVTWRYEGEQFAQDVCEHFTHDHRVFAVIQFMPTGPTTRGCFGKRGMPTLDGVAAEMSDADLNRDSTHFLIAGVTIDRLAVLLVEGLARQGFFANRDRVGVVTYDREAYHRAVDRIVVPRLRALGHTDTEVVYLTHPSQDENRTAADAGNAVLRFRQNGVRRVLIFEGIPYASGTFTAAAASQETEFWYGLTTLSGPSMEFKGGKTLVDESALRKATVVGWHSLADLPYDRGGIRELPPAAQQWRRALAARGLTYESCCALGYALVGIEKLLFVAAGVTAGRGGLDGVSFRAGVEGLGASYGSVLTYGTRFGVSRHDGVDAYRIATWDRSCPCLRYRTPPLRAPAR